MMTDRNAALTADEKRVAQFAVSKGWLFQRDAEEAIKAMRGKRPKPWIVSEVDHALYAVRHDNRNKWLVNGQPK
jgi:uncharacterized protein with von Willebrand factor type A (vWA) domain